MRHELAESVIISNFFDNQKKFSTDESSFGSWENGASNIDAHLPGEMKAESLKSSPGRAR
jgi:hypothetical protein